MKAYKSYKVAYKMDSCSDVKEVTVKARNKGDAYSTATYLVIPHKEQYVPYSSWVVSVTHADGSTHEFNTCEGMAY